MPSYGVVPNFALTDQSGEPFDSREKLDGKVWLANFVFTTCTGPCPRMTLEFKKIRAATREYPDFKLVSFTIDPERDTPSVLASYARAHSAQPEYWAFLTGPQAELSKLSYDTFRLAKIDGSLEHSTKFVLVDKKGRIRGYYGTIFDEEGVKDLLADIKTLLQATL
jgi:protein SCO1/2